MTELQEQLILKFLDGSITSEDRQKLDEWVNQSEENRRVLTEYAMLWQSSEGKPVTDFSTDEEWSKVETRIESHNLTKRTPSKFVWLRAAAVIAFFGIAIWAYLILFDKDVTTLQSHGTIEEHVLPDGTKVWLNIGSQLSFKSDFGNKERHVTMEGEGYFDVTRNPDLPFIIEASDSRIRVLGTSFNVQAYGGSTSTNVFVTEGRVEFSSVVTGESVVMVKDQNATLANGTVTLANDAGNVNALAWREKRLTFKKATMTEVVTSLEKYFKIRIKVVSPDVLRCHYTGSFSDPQLKEILESLTIALELNIVLKDDAYEVVGKGC